MTDEDRAHRQDHTKYRVVAGILIGAGTGLYIGVFKKSILDGLIVGAAEVLVIGYSMKLRKKHKTRPAPPRQPG